MPPLLITPGSTTILEEEEEEEEESFFDLEIIDLTDSHDRENNLQEDKHNSGIQGRHKGGGSFQQRRVPASPGEKSLSKRKILPVEGLHRHQSPISLLKSPPKFPLFMFAKSKSTTEAKKDTVGMGMTDTWTKQCRNRESPLMALKFKGKEIQIQPFFARISSLRDTTRGRGRGHVSDDSVSSKRFSRDVMQKYLRFVKPLYAKSSKKQDSSETFAKEFPVSASSGSGKPPEGTLSKHLGKSRSASAATSLRALSPARMDDSLLQHHDGIQSAILHCKRSFSASRDFSPLS